MNKENVDSTGLVGRKPEPAPRASVHRFVGRRQRICFYYLYTAFTLGAATALLIPQSAAGRGSNFVFSVAWVFMHAISVFLFLGFRRHRGADLAIVSAIGSYIIISFGWSASPINSLIYGSMVAGNIATAYMISRDLDLEAIIVMSARVILALAVSGTIAGALGYSQALYFEGAGRLTIIGTHPIRGFFNHKVPAALYATIGALACLSCYRGSTRFFAVSALGIFVILTGSSTGLTIFPVGILIFFTLRRVSRVKREASARSIALTCLFLGGLIVLALSAYLDVILVWLGRDPTLTGRTLLWDWGIKTWLQSPFIGWGFDGYLNGPDAGAISAEVKRFENYDVPHFHQSYIQTAVDLGVVGLLILVGMQISVIRRGWRYMRESHSDIGVSVLSIVAITVIAAMTMFLFITYNHYATLITFALFFALRRRAFKLRSVQR